MLAPLPRPAAPAPPLDVAGAPSALLPVYAQLPVEPISGDGSMLLTRDGRRLIDFYGGHAVALLGYGHPRFLAALERQARALHFQSNAVPAEVRERAAAALVAIAPEGLSQVAFFNSGAEANENALRIAFRATGRERVVAVEGAFHGRTAAAAAVTWGASKWYGFPRAPFDVHFAARTPEAVAAAIDDRTAAVILEPIQGVAGARPLGVELLEAARAATLAHGALLILDEVQSGMGRVGAPFAARLYGVTPDLLTVGKGLAGGLPASAVVARPEAGAGLGVGDLGTTFGGGQLAMAAVEEVIAILLEEGLIPRARVLAEQIRRACAVGPVVGFQGEGLLLGLRTTRAAATIQAELLARGILVGTSADPHVIRLLPPLVLGAAQVEALAAALAELPA